MKNIFIGLNRSECFAQWALNLLDTKLGATCQTEPNVFDHVFICFCLTIWAIESWQIRMDELDRSCHGLVDASDHVFVDFNLNLETVKGDLRGERAHALVDILDDVIHRH